MLKLRSTRSRPVHLGPFPLETLARCDAPPPGALPKEPPPPAEDAEAGPLARAMRDYRAMMDATRDGAVKTPHAVIPDDPQERARHLKAFAHFCDARMVGICRLPEGAWRADPVENPGVARLRQTLATVQPSSLAAGIDGVLAGLRESLATPPGDIRHHTHAIVLLYDHPREVRPGEAGAAWLRDAQAARAALRGAETAVVLAQYLRSLGHDARAQTASAREVDLGALAQAAGLVALEDGALVNPFCGTRYGLAAVTTTLALAPDRPLVPGQRPPLAYRLGLGAQEASAARRDPYARRDFAQGPHPFETLRRVDEPTTYIDAVNVPRVPKRASMFARALFGDMGRGVQEAAKNGNYVRKSAAAFAFRPTLAAFALLQDGAPAPARQEIPPEEAAQAVKAACYFLGIDAVGISACPDWCWYSHDPAGREITPRHAHAISMIVDQGFETMEGASGDDWIACAQSMRAYLRFSLLGGVIAQLIRDLGHDAQVHSVMSEEVLHPPLLLLSGLGEVSRIGEVILNPFLGPRLKSGVVTTSLPLAHDRPIDFGLQRFCEACNKCARECPSGAITAGPKKMFNGYEIWKSDSQKCTTYRITQEGGAMCGRCMKTCPWNLEGLFAEAPFRRLAMAAPGAAKALAALDDRLGRGRINPVKRWWWDLEMRDDGPYGPPRAPVNRRDLQPGLDLRPEDQTLAVYPAPLAPPPHPWPAPMDREAGIAAHQALIDAGEHRRRRAAGLPPEHPPRPQDSAPPVLSLVVARAERIARDVMLYELAEPDGRPLPPATAGAHVDVVVAPEYFRQYSLAGDPADRARYVIAVLREDRGRGGSALMHRIFTPGRRVHVSHPINHFPLVEEAPMSFLMGGGIGITPMIAMAHRLHALGRRFALHYAFRDRAGAGFVEALEAMPWAASVHLHESATGGRADLAALLRHEPGAQVYTCGPDRFMEGVLAAAEAAGFPEEARHKEYFALPEEPDYVDHPFALRLRDGREIAVPADLSAAEALIAAGVPVDLKCADGLCGVCRCGVVSGAVEHRDFVLSKAQREAAMILCRSRAAEPGGVIDLDL